MSDAGRILQTLSQELAGLVERTARSVVAVHGRERLPASGLVLQKGVIVTPEEPLERDEDIEVTLPDGTRAAATLAGRDPSTDIAVLRCEAADGPTLAPASSVRAGGIALAVGRSGASTLSAFGAVALAGPAWRSSHGGSIDALIRLDLSLHAEGGAAVDADGDLIGMLVFGPRGRILVVPTRTIERVAERILAGGSVGRGYLGVGLQPVRIEEGRAGMIAGLDPQGPGAHAGLLLGDILRTWNGEEVSGPRAIVERLGPESVGTTVELGILRAGTPLRVLVEIAERPKA